jgi:predicted outer membrane lipoprotein
MYDLFAAWLGVLLAPVFAILAALSALVGQ